jgi:integrase/recombinase XerD
LRHPEHAGTIGRVLAMPSKRFEWALVTYLGPNEVEALLQSPDPATWAGRRGRALMLLMVQTGLRVSELIALRRNDIYLGAGAHVACHGKGRKDRITPLTKPTVDALHCWLAQSPGAPTDPVFPTRTGRTLSRDAIERRLTRHQAAAARTCPSLNAKHITAHVLRHSRCSPARGRRRGQRNPRMARSRRPVHHQPLRRDQHQNETGSPSRL